MPSKSVTVHKNLNNGEKRTVERSHFARGTRRYFPFHFIPSRHAMLPPKFLNDLVVPNSTLFRQREANHRASFLVWRVLQEALAGRHPNAVTNCTLSRTSAYA